MNGITKQTTGPLAHYSTLAVVAAVLLSAMAACRKRGVRYGLGAKAPETHKAGRPVFSSVPNFAAIDCSGWVRWAVYVATKGATLLPDGSWNQLDWFRTNGFKETDYSNCALRDGHVRIAFHKPGGRGGDGTGHVWIVIDGVVYESCGGEGPYTGHEWDHDWFVSHVDACFVIC